MDQFIYKNQQTGEAITEEPTTWIKINLKSETMD